jgi:hypothetical protein
VTGGQTSALPISKSGLYLVAPGLMLQNGLAIAAFASVANVVILHGYVNRLDY